MNMYKEYSDIAIPQCLDNEKWIDSSWHNDATASSIENTENRMKIQVWVNSDNVTLRECFEDFKFMIVILDDETGDIEENEILCNTEEELLQNIEYIKTIIHN